ETQALWVMAALIGLTALAILGQALARQTYLDSDELPTLRAIGMSRRQLFGLGISRAAVIGFMAAAASIPIAILLSPLTPVGLARIAEPGPGRAAVPTRSAIFGAALSIVALTAALVFAASLDHVLATPSVSGFTWDAFVAVGESRAVVLAEAALRADPRVADYGRGGYV